MPVVKRRSTSAKPPTPAPVRKVIPKTTVRVKSSAQNAKPAQHSGSSASEKTKAYAIADARAKLSEIFDYVLSEQSRCFVRGGDPKKTKFLTFDYKERYMVEPIMDISIYELKSHFSTYSTFVRLGMCFRVSRRTSNEPVFLRRFTKYSDPLDTVMTDYIERRTRKAVEDALSARTESGIEKALLSLRHAQEGNTAEVMEEIKRISTGIGRMAVNRHPFRDVPLRKDVIILGDDE